MVSSVWKSAHVCHAPRGKVSEIRRNSSLPRARMSDQGRRSMIARLWLNPLLWTAARTSATDQCHSINVARFLRAFCPHRHYAQLKRHAASVPSCVYHDQLVSAGLLSGNGTLMNRCRFNNRNDIAVLNRCLYASASPPLPTRWMWATSNACTRPLRAIMPYLYRNQRCRLIPA